MRRSVWIAASVATLLVAVAGCSGKAQSATSTWNASQFVVLGSEPSTENAATSAMPGLAASSIPREALKGIPGADDVAVTTGTSAITRQQAIDLTRPKDGTLVSAVYVALPIRFMQAVFNDPKKAKPRTAWLVTWTGVALHRIGAAGTGPRPLRSGHSTVVIDATTGEQLLLTQYSTP
jgi:hypothetical protein